MNLSLAPIQGMTVACYRNAFAEIFGGIHTYYAPFIGTTHLKKASPLLLKDIQPENNDQNVHLIPQLLGNSGEDFNEFASAIVNLGYREINWNIGCPFPMVTNKKKGSGILIYPDLIRTFLDVVCKDLNYTLTVKMRLGMDEFEEGLRVIHILNEYPLGGVIIHARTGAQMYTGTVDLDAFEVLRSECKHLIIYNGDIYTVNDYIKFHERFPMIDHYMLGRGALSDPFLPASIQGHPFTCEEKKMKIIEFHTAIFTHYQDKLYGDKHVCDKMKEFWSYMAPQVDHDGKFLKRIKKCHTAATYLDVVDYYLNHL